MCRFGVPLAPVAQPADGPWASALTELADAAGLTVVAGGFTPGSRGRVRNTLFARGGGIHADYDKVHLYDAFGFAESDSVEPGAEPVLLDVDGVGVGLTTCYDLRFPGLFTHLAGSGAPVVVVSASWGAGPGKVEQWDCSPAPGRWTRPPSWWPAGRRWPPRTTAGRRPAWGAQRRRRPRTVSSSRSWGRNRVASSSTSTRRSPTTSARSSRSSQPPVLSARPGRRARTARPTAITGRAATGAVNR